MTIERWLKNASNEALERKLAEYQAQRLSMGGRDIDLVSEIIRKISQEIADRGLTG